MVIELHPVSVPQQSFQHPGVVVFPDGFVFATVFFAKITN